MLERIRNFTFGTVIAYNDFSALRLFVRNTQHNITVAYGNNGAYLSALNVQIYLEFRMFIYNKLVHTLHNNAVSAL